MRWRCPGRATTPGPGWAPSLRAIRHAWLTDVIAPSTRPCGALTARHACTPIWSFGYGITIGHNTVSLLMRRAGLPGRSRGTRTRRPITITGLVHCDFHRTGRTSSG